jgi:hypothetical protein
MPLNLLKVYPALLELDYLTESQRTKSLYGVFRRDIEDNAGFSFKTKRINPIKVEIDAMQLLFKHLTTEMVDETTRKREFEPNRSKRLHWIRHHVEERKKENMIVFSVREQAGIRTYIHDVEESYVIVLEPYRDQKEYYLITAYSLEERNSRKIQNKFGRRLPDLY